MNKLRRLLHGGIGLVVAGVLLSASPLLEYWRSTRLERAAASPFLQAASVAAVPQPVLVQGTPARLAIPSLGIDLAITEGTYDSHSRTWTLTNDKAQYATATPAPNNQQGNTFLYGHNRPGVFNSLNQIKVGDEAIITTAEGHTFTYRFRVAYETKPTDTSLFEYQGPPLLTLQTCSGLWYQNRQLFTFDFAGVA